jgi:hypothetical protein
VERKPVAFARGDELELEARRPGFGKHARTLQEDMPWLAPLSETPQAADDLVVRARD